MEGGSETAGEVFQRRMTDRNEKFCPCDIICPPEEYVFRSPFLSKLLAFTVNTKLQRLKSVTESVMSTDQPAWKQRERLKDLAELLVQDPRLGNHLDPHVLKLLVRFLENKQDFDFQYYSAMLLQTIVSSHIGPKVKDETVPYLLNLIPSPDSFVQIQGLYTLSKIANAYPDSCDTMIKNGGLELLESLFTNKENKETLLESGGVLLTALCRTKPNLSSDEITKVVRIINIAMDYDFEMVLIQVCLALSILSDRGFVEIGTEVIRLLDLINHPVYKVVLSALRTIGNYVRCGNEEDIQFMIERALLLRLGNLLCFKYTIVRKEACWIISNITAVANNSHIQEVIDRGLIDMLVRVVRHDEFEVKEVAAHAISNVVSGSDKKQFMYLKEKCFPLLDDLRLIYCRDDKRVVTLCTKILQLGNIRACMTSGTTADLASASAECAQRLEKITKKKKKNPRRCKKLSTVASPADPSTDLTGDLGSEVFVKVSLDSSMKDLDSKIIAGENKLEESKKKFTAASLVNLIKPPRNLDSEEIVSREKPLSVDYTEDLCSKKLKKDKKLSSSTLLPDSFIDPIDSAGKITRGKKLLPDSSIDPVNPAEEITSLKKLSTTASSSVNSTGNLDSVQIVSRVKHLSIDDSEDLGSKKLKKGNKLFTVASPESSIGCTNDLGSKKITNECNLNKATDNYPSRAQKNKLKQGKKLSTTASEDNTVTKATIQENYPSRARKNKLKQGKKLSTTASEDNTVTKATIQELLDAELLRVKRVMRLSCEATIVDVLQYYGWYYNACPNCFRKIQIKHGKPYCNACPQKTGPVIPRYKLFVNVKDHTGVATFILPNMEVERMIGVPIQTLISEIGQDKLTQYIPPTIKNVKGRKCTFEVNLTPYNRSWLECYTVARLAKVIAPPPHGPDLDENDDEDPAKKQRVVRQTLRTIS